MTLKPLVLVLALASGCSGCTQFNKAVTVSVAGPSAELEVARLEPEPEPEIEPGRGGVDPHRALRSAEASTNRWKRQGPSRLASLPPAFKTPGAAEAVDPGASKASGTKASLDADANMQRIERGGRVGMGTICQGC